MVHQATRDWTKNIVREFASDFEVRLSSAFSYKHKSLVYYL